MNPELREAFLNALVSRVVENAPLRELIRVYSEAVNSAVRPMDDDALLASAVQAGYSDLLNVFDIPLPVAATEVGTEEAEEEESDKKKTRKKAAAAA